MEHFIDLKEDLNNQNMIPQHTLISAAGKVFARGLYNESINKFSNNIELDGNLLEIGTFNGAGAKGIAEKFPHKKIYVVDPFIEDGYTGYQIGLKLNSQRHNAIKNLNKPNVILFEMKSTIFKEKWIDKVKDIDIIIIDGSHNYDDVCNDLEIVDIVLRPEGFVYVDDYHNIKDVEKACLEFFEDNNSYIKLREGLYKRISQG